MGIFGALTVAVTGMRAQSFALENISGNIANSQTTAFKRLDTSFEDMVTSSIPGTQTAGTVVARSRSTNNAQGDIQNSSTSTFMAVNGDGYFVVAKPTSFVDGRPVLGVEMYTRRGDFQTDQSGFLVNGAGYYLLGIPTDPTTGNPLGSVPEVLQFNRNLSPATATSVIRYAANLPSVPVTKVSDPNVPDSEVLDPTAFTSDPTMLTGSTGIVVGNDVSVFLDQTVAGGALTVYDSLGVSENMQFRWAKVAGADPSATPPSSGTWELFYQTEANPALGTDPAWINVGQEFVFDVNGKLNPPINNLTLTGVSLNGHVIGDIQMAFGTDGITQYADVSGTVKVNTLQQNGSAAGTLDSISVNDQNRIVGTFTNGLTVTLAEVTLAHFNAENRLSAQDGGAFAATAESGSALYNATGSIVGSALEGSNTDIADEFTKLIVTQQAYSANTRIITTGNEMIQDLLNMIR
jgi:flagellar hook protein FlgE